MNWDYSENMLVQKSAADLLENTLGWDVIFAHNKEILGKNGTLCRGSYKEIVLTRYLRQAMFNLNNWLTEEYCDTAVP